MATVDIEVVDVDTVQSLLDCLENGKNHTNKFTPYIYMVPSLFRDLSPNSFKPRVVSIGPLHREDQKLKEFEVYKASSVHDFLHGLQCEPKQIFPSCVDKVNASIDDIRGCYAGMKNYGNGELAKMMVMDACFILEIIWTSFKNDMPVIRNMLPLPQSVIYDLLLLENQIPFFVLNDIFQCIFPGVKNLIIFFSTPFLEFVNPFNKVDLHIPQIYADTTPDHILDPPDHILDLLHKCYRPRPPSDIPSDFSSLSIHSAVHLERAGVNFKPNKNANWSLDMKVKLHKIPGLSYSRANPTLRMPILRIHDQTELILRNLMAYEQFSRDDNKIVTSYVVAMDMLVNTEEDIAILVKSKVLVNCLGSNDEAVNMINNICKEVARRHLYEEQWKNLDCYWRYGYWPKHFRRLRRIYFSSPWNIIALVAGIVLFGLTVVQTIYAVKELK